MLYTITLEGNKTNMDVDVYGHFTRYIEATYWQPAEGGYFEIEKIEKDGQDITDRLDRCKGLIKQIEEHIEENYKE